jgi:hypothetical protein
VSFQKIGIFTSSGSAEKNADDFDALKREGIEVIVGDVHNEEDVKDALWYKSTLYLPNNVATIAATTRSMGENVIKF